MKHFLLLCLLLCISFLPSRADTIVNLTSGTLTLTGAVNVSSTLFAPGYVITGLQGDNSLSIGYECQGGCTLQQIASYSPLVAFVPNGSMVVNGQLVGLWGFPGFTATTFHSSLSSAGVLSVWGQAAPFGFVGECLPLGPDCGSTGLQFQFGSTKWHYYGTFVPDPYNKGLFDLSSLTITTTPEPTTFLLIGTGLVAIWFQQRNRLRGAIERER